MHAATGRQLTHPEWERVDTILSAFIPDFGRAGVSIDTHQSPRFLNSMLNIMTRLIQRVRTSVHAWKHIHAWELNRRREQEVKRPILRTILRAWREVADGHMARTLRTASDKNIDAHAISRLPTDTLTATASRTNPLCLHASHMPHTSSFFSDEATCTFLTRCEGSDLASFKNRSSLPAGSFARLFLQYVRLVEGGRLAHRRSQHGDGENRRYIARSWRFANVAHKQGLTLFPGHGNWRTWHTTPGAVASAPIAIPTELNPRRRTRERISILTPIVNLPARLLLIWKHEAQISARRDRGHVRLLRMPVMNTPLVMSPVTLVDATPLISIADSQTDRLFTVMYEGRRARLRTSFVDTWDTSAYTHQEPFVDTWDTSAYTHQEPEWLTWLMHDTVCNTRDGTYTSITQLTCDLQHMNMTVVTYHVDDTQLELSLQHLQLQTHLQRELYTHPLIQLRSSLALPIPPVGIEITSSQADHVNLAAHLGELRLLELHALTRDSRTASSGVHLRRGVGWLARARDRTTDTHDIHAVAPVTSTAATSQAGRWRLGNTVKWIIGKISGFFHRDAGRNGFSYI